MSRHRFPSGMSRPAKSLSAASRSSTGKSFTYHSGQGFIRLGWSSRAQVFGSAVMASAGINRPSASSLMVAGSTPAPSSNTIPSTGASKPTRTFGPCSRATERRRQYRS